MKKVNVDRLTTTGLRVRLASFKDDSYENIYMTFAAWEASSRPRHELFNNDVKGERHYWRPTGGLMAVSGPGKRDTIAAGFMGSKFLPLNHAPSFLYMDVADFADLLSAEEHKSSFLHEESNRHLGSRPYIGKSLNETHGNFIRH